MSSTTSTAPFSKAVVASMRRLYPEDLAEKAWDNTGLLLEAPFDPSRRQRNSVLLTVDLTKAVTDEAIERKASIIIAYHPIIFRGLKSITLANSQQQSLLRLAAAGISACPSQISPIPGLGDWLADIITGQTPPNPSHSQPTPSTKPTDDPFTQKRPTFQLQHYPSASQVNTALNLGVTKHTRAPIKPVDFPDRPGAGMGRIVRFAEAQPLAALIERVAAGVGNPKGFPIAIPQGKAVDEISVKSVGICAGSGGSLFAGLSGVDMLFTGELSHHEALAAIESGQSVVTLFHSNTERGFLHGVLRAQLLETVKEEWEKIRKEETGGDEEAMSDETVEVEVSERDRDPFGILVNEAWQ
ncbi:NGG1 interacting factor Nif3 [Pseudovirgaria hyperparasitica]|uniref:NGG1 interacting factor Nif3 n=1 Tax=Pseudovirgaria hyperparasitica TaxID=470096 RepID=A0A6A6VUD2_9PEZI|nr:NGG1 interacting factor Nif3 [Pseudovirgaria hyperparasitica]KAF2753765.1 NGG1 interacting factor Nif3 [Pseudovirgaria hyperparasitica]